MTIADGPCIEGIDSRVSRLALGTASYRLDSRDTWFSILDEFAGQGGALIDTARDYGESETVVGNWVACRSARDRVVLATKGGQGTGHGLRTADFARTIRRELHESLDALQTGHVDLYWLHRDSPEVPVDEIMSCLADLVKEGSVRALGASNWSYERVTEANEYARRESLPLFTAVSNHLSLAVAEAPFYPGLVSVGASGERWHEQTGIPLVPWSAQARGFFTGRYASGESDTKDDPFTARMREVYGSDENFERLRRALTLGADKGDATAMQIALRWLLYKPFAVIPIVGPRTVGEVDSCCRATQLRMTPDEAAWLDLGSEQLRKDAGLNT